MKGDKAMSIFAQVSSTPESVYEEIYQEKFTEDYYVNLFLDKLVETAKNYIVQPTITMSIDTYIRVLIRCMIYKETKRSISLSEKVSYPAVLYTFNKIHIRFRGWGRGYPFIDDRPVESYYCYAILENEIIRAFKNRFGEEFNYAEICKDYRIQEALKFHV